MTAPTQHKIGFFKAIGYGFKGYINFWGRATRAEFWYWNLFGLLSLFALGILIDQALIDQLSAVEDYVIFAWWFVLIYPPSFFVGIRRLHDNDRRGWWILIAPTGIGIIFLFIWACQKGTEGTNRFGESRTTVRLENNDQFGLDAEVELEFWRSIKDSADPDMFRAYLEKYPNGKFLELAKIKLQSLQGHQIIR